MSNSVRSHRQQPTRLCRPWDSPGKNTGVGCHFLLQCMKVKSESEVAQLCPTLCDPMDCSPPGSSVHRIFQAGVLEWGAIAFSIRRAAIKKNIPMAIQRQGQKERNIRLPQVIEVIRFRCLGDFPGGPVARTLHSQCSDSGSIPGQGLRSHMSQIKIPHATMKSKGAACHN